MVLTFRKFLQTIYFHGDLMVVAKKSLIYDNSFDLPSSANFDLIISLRVLVRTMREILLSSSSKFEELNEIVALDAKYKNKNSLQDYVKINELDAFSDLYSTDKVYNHISNLNKLRVILLAILTFIVVLPFVFSKRRANYALCIKYVCLIDAMSIRLRNSSTKIIYDFAAYFNYSNLATLVYRDLGIKIIKVPSIVPLAAHLSGIIADNLALSTPYHLDEFNYFNKQMRVGKRIFTYPKHSQYLMKYKNNNFPDVKQNLGYYSHASWLRSKQDHADSHFGLPLQEELLVHQLSEYCKNREGLKFLIYTHPKERKLELREETEAHYRKLIDPNVDFEIYLDESPSSVLFELAEVGVGTMSSVLFERLLCGYKTIFFSQNMSLFPVPNSTIKSICACNSVELNQYLEDAFGIDRSEFFMSKKIDRYRFDSDFYKIERL